MVAAGGGYCAQGSRIRLCRVQDDLRRYRSPSRCRVDEAEPEKPYRRGFWFPNWETFFESVSALFFPALVWVIYLALFRRLWRSDFERT